MNSKIMIKSKNDKITFECKIKLIERIEKITEKKHTVLIPSSADTFRYRDCKIITPKM